MKSKEGELDNFRSYCEKFIKLTKSEKNCLYYGFSISGNKAHCREGYTDGDGALAHLDNVGALLQESLATSPATFWLIRATEFGALV